jgi:hypothetical protein
MAFFSGEVIQKAKKFLKDKKKVVRLMCSVNRRSCCRELFKSLNILPVPRVYIMETVCYTKLNNKGLKQNSAIHDYKIRHRSDFQTQFCRTNMLKKSVNNLGTKLYNTLPNHLKNLEDLKPFKKQVKTLLLQQSFYSIKEYLSYV